MKKIDKFLSALLVVLLIANLCVTGMTAQAEEIIESNAVTETQQETKAPETQAPETKAPETQAPETQAPETKAPETQTPETKAPETQAETKAPEMQTADTTQETTAGSSEKVTAETSETAKVQDALELTYTIKNSKNQIIWTIKANIPEGTFDANTSEVTMKVTDPSDSTINTIEELMDKSITDDELIANWFLFGIDFQVNGKTVEPKKAITITFDTTQFEIEDTDKATVFYYNEAKSVAGNKAAEIREIAKRADVIKYLKDADKSTKNIDKDYDLTDIAVKSDKSTVITTEGRRSTVYGCYLVADKPVEETETTLESESMLESETETETEMPQITVATYEDDDIIVDVTADSELVIPTGATLQVTPITKTDNEDAYTEVENQLNDKASTEDYEIAGFLAYDIKFVDDEGNEVEPTGKVNVSMSYKNAALPEGIDEETAKNADVTVMHLEEDEKGNVQQVVDMVADENVEATVQTTDAQAVEKVELVTDSFSYYTITWTNKNISFNLYFCDTDGNILEGSKKESINLDANTYTLSNYSYLFNKTGYTFDHATIGTNSNNIKAELSSAVIYRIRYDSSKTQYNTSERASWGWTNLESGQNIYMVYKYTGYSFYDFNGTKLTLESYNGLLDTMLEEIEKGPAVPITNWKRSSTTIALSDFKNKHTWTWSDITSLALDIADQSKVWDGSRLNSNNTVEHNYNNYIDRYGSGSNDFRDSVSAYNDVLYDSATWTRTSTNNDATMYRFRGEFNLPEDMNPNDYSFTLKQVTPGNEMYINDDIYVFVYPKNVTLSNNNFMDYLAFWTGTSNQSGTISFQGRLGTAVKPSFTNNANKYLDYSKVTDGWCMEAVDDNAANAILNAYNESGTTDFYVDVFTDDYASGGGMYRLQMETKAQSRYPISFTKVVDGHETIGIPGVKFELNQINNEGKATGVHYDAISDATGTVNLNVVAGNYTMTEIATEGYTQPNGTWTVKVSEGGSYNITWNGDATSQIRGSQGSYKITNKSSKKGAYTFKKVTSKGTGLSGAQFRVTYEDNTAKDYTSGSDGSVVLTNLEIGTYTITETSAPGDYIASTDTWIIEVAYDGTTNMYKDGDAGKTKVTQVVNYTQKEAAVSTLTNTKTAQVIDEENRIFQIDLGATVTGRGEDVITPVSMVLVLDASASMNQDGKSLDDVKTAAASLIDSIYSNSPGSEINVIWYNGGSTDTVMNEKLASASGFKTISNKNTIVSFVNSKDASGGTPMNAALKKAYNAIKNEAKNSNKYVVFFTDGMPGHVSSNDYANWNCAIANGANNYASKIKSTSDGNAILYTVGYGLSSSDIFTWHIGDSDSSTANNNGPYYNRVTYHSDHSEMTGSKFLSDYIATQGTKTADGSNPYAYSANTSGDLIDAFEAIAKKAGALNSIQPENIVDVIDSRFELTVQSENELKAKYGNDLSITKNADGTTTLTWTGDSANIKNAEDGGWKASLYVQAKADFVGGNMIPTNGDGSGINIDNETFRSFPKPSVNVKLLTPSIDNFEMTVYKGDLIESSKFSTELANTYEIVELDGNTKLTAGNSGIPKLTEEDLINLAKGNQIKKDYAYPGTDDKVGHFEYSFKPSDTTGGYYEEHKATTVGNAVEVYELVVVFVPDTIDIRKAEVSVNPPTDKGGTIVTNNSVTGTYTVNVLDRWNIVKRSSSNNNLYLSGAEFMLTSSEEPTKIYYGKSADDQTGTVYWYNDKIYTEPVNLSKMGAGVYILKETVAPEGYLLSAEKWQITIGDNGQLESIKNSDGNLSIEKTTVTNVGDCYYFDNTIAYELPSAGGIGTYWYTIGGVLIMMGAMLILYRKRNEGGETL